AIAAAQQPPPPQPFPRSGNQTAPAASPAPPSGPTPGAAGSQLPPAGVPADVAAGLPGVMYPSSQLLQTFELGRSQRCFLYGTNASFAEVLAYYKQQLKDSGRE